VLFADDVVLVDIGWYSSCSLREPSEHASFGLCKHLIQRFFVKPLLLPGSLPNHICLFAKFADSAPFNT